MSDVVTIARGWIGTPYRHQGSRKGVGCDCLGLIRGIWRERYGEEPETPGAYGMDWAERSGEERLYLAALRHFGDPVPAALMAPGDILLFRWREGASAKHLGILSGPGRFIHAYEQAGVIESALVPSWRRRVAWVFRWSAGEPHSFQSSNPSLQVSGVARRLHGNGDDPEARRRD